MQKLLDYCYTGFYNIKSSDVSSDLALKILQSAKYFDLKSPNFT